MPIVPETTKLYSVLYSRCARCHVGNLYEDNNPYHLSKLGKMKTSCPCCGQSYEPETGFYYGAMYVSYGLGVAQAIPLLGLLWWLLDLDPIVIFSVIIGLMVALFPVTFRFSRNIWLNIFVAFDEEKYLACKAAGSSGKA